MTRKSHQPESPFVFEHHVIDANPPGTENDICLIADINGNGLNDILIGGKHGRDNIVWYENPGWTRHTIGTAHLEAGGVLIDINGSGRLDLVAGNPYDGPNRELYWFECPEDTRQLWTQRTITDRFIKYHDQAIGDIDADGEPEILFSSQLSQVVGYLDIPEDPTVAPWPRACCHIIAEGLSVEGLLVVDLDGDGANEVIAGPNIFKRSSGGAWLRTAFAPDFRDTRLAVADLDGDGVLDIVLAEGEAEDGRAAWFKGPRWQMNLLGGGLFRPHSLGIADFSGDGLPDIFVGEMGLGATSSPRELIFRNLGDGRFDVHVIDNLPTHDAKVGDVTGNGRPDIVGKPYHPGNQVDLWINCS